ncbi:MULTISPECIES: DNA repair protein RecO [Alkalimonas]|uniref:DNA repair protein RecO n=1 Tax=Alkalimonas mucilaginosa TaxID=3057676 RepID=A0ABU7JCV9_9GAMM|nr:DNA repair protein RecO C-terminal domain-containing protein [Alkalimonas sp. MEB004]MEE2023208.1 recombination protein O N-terminal domain-containing protein [Alkalimonas sp. MEB004]
MAKTNCQDQWHSAYILHRRPLAEHKVILQLLLPELGRLSAVVRKRTGKQRQPLQPFQLLTLQLGGRSELKTVLKLEEQGPGLQLQGLALFSAFYLNELICRIWPDNLASEQLFLLYQQALQQLTLAQHQASLLEPALRQFEFSLLSELGQPVDWQLDADGLPLLSEQCYLWQHEQGWQPDGRGWQGHVLLRIGQGDWAAADCRLAAKQISRLLLQPWLGDKPLQSRALFQSTAPAGDPSL